jgi:hypothetical protein
LMVVTERSIDRQVLPLSRTAPVGR